MEGQISVEEWMPSACPGTKEYEEAKEEKTKAKKKTFTENVGPQMKPLNKISDEAMLAHRENWYALLVAIMRDDINSADDALAAMGVKRQYTQQRKRGRRKKAAAV